MKVVAVTACPSGVAHTYMAAEALQIAGEKLGVDIKVETQGAGGIENRLTEEEIKEAVCVVLSTDTSIRESRPF